MAKIKKQKYVKHKEKKTSSKAQNVASNKNNITIHIGSKSRQQQTQNSSNRQATNQQQKQLQQLQQILQQPTIQYRTPTIINTKTYNTPAIAPPDKQDSVEVVAKPPVDRVEAIENSLHRLHETIQKEDVNAHSLGMRQPIIGFNAPKKVEPTQLPTSRKEYENKKQSLMTSFISEKPRAEPAPKTPTPTVAPVIQTPPRTPIAETFDRNLVADGDEGVVVRAKKVYSRSDPYPNRNTQWFNTIPASERDKIYQWKSLPANKRGDWRDYGLVEPPNTRVEKYPSRKDGKG